MKQINLFGSVFEPNKDENKYSSKVSSPIYEPKNKIPHVLELLNDGKAKRLITEVEQSTVSDEEKTFLIQAAKRHIVFNYSNVADYYAHATKEMQYLMERSALVIIDFENAINNGYVKLSDELRKQYLEEYGE